MSELVVQFGSQPQPNEIPAEVCDPFTNSNPPAIARHAAAVLQEELRGGEIARLVDEDRRGRGKMFGVLVVRDVEGQYGSLRGFSGMLGGQWRIPGFVPPLFDQQARDSFWLRGEEELYELERRQQDLRGGEHIEALRSELAAVREAQQEERARFDAERGQRSEQRSVERERVARLSAPERTPEPFASSRRNIANSANASSRSS
jgi:tRNA pseudouridine32 synthase/23S rRNA pseudouridine746 synthase